MSHRPQHCTEDRVSDQLRPARLCDIKLAGLVGERLHTVISARMLSEHAGREICAEAVDAFRKRVDDRLRPRCGFWQGEFWGKWILGVIGAAQYTGDDRLVATVADATGEILATQDRDGYLGTYHDSGFVHSIEGRPNWNIWCRKYTLWGLLEAARLLHRADIVQAAARMMDHLMRQVGPERLDIIDTGKFAGLPSTSILTPVLMLYRATGCDRYLDYARYIVEQWSRRPGGPPDIVNRGLTGRPVHQWFSEPEKWAKAYEFISCLEGLIELYRVTGKQDYLRAAMRTHAAIRAADRLVTGGIGRNDKLVGARRLLQSEAEVCDAIYWNRLSAQLLRLTGDSLYADEIERTLYNMLCCAMRADGTWGVRRLCLSGEHWPAPPHCELKTHHCCVDNLPRGLLQAARLAVMQSRAGIAVNLYVPGEMALRDHVDQPLTLRIETDYPASDTVRLRFAPTQPHTFEVALRIPAWSNATVCTVNGQATPQPAGGEYLRIERRWETGDLIELEMDMSPRLTPFPGTAEGSYVAVQRGPLVLARDIRLGPPELSVPLTVPETLRLQPAESPEGVRLAFQSNLKAADTGQAVGLCDYASAGNTWDRKTSDFRLWLPTVRPVSAQL